MSSAIFDFADIRSRMLGNDKPAPRSERKKFRCDICADSGWIMWSRTLAPGHSFTACSSCGNPEAKPCP